MPSLSTLYLLTTIRFLSNPDMGWPVRTDIPAHGNDEVACEWLGYVSDDFMGSESNIV
jgi:hypothetical protein